MAKKKNESLGKNTTLQEKTVLQYIETIKLNSYLIADIFPPQCYFFVYSLFEQRHIPNLLIFPWQFIWAMI